MRKLKITKEELDKLSDNQKGTAIHFAMPSGWNALGNPDIFRYIQENILNYFLKKKHSLDKLEIEMVEKEMKIQSEIKVKNE